MRVRRLDVATAPVLVDTSNRLLAQHPGRLVLDSSGVGLCDAAGLGALARILVGALRSEWTKIRTVRSTVWSLVAMAGISLELMSLIAWATTDRWARLEPAEQASLMHRPLQIS